jgi:histidyl-tRNA synthetase
MKYDRQQWTVLGGGRYDGLLELLGGPATPAVGFGSGIERIILEMERWEAPVPEPSRPDVFVVHKAAGSGPIAFGLANALRNAGVGVVVGESARSFKAQFRHADGSGARFAVILGQSEVDAGTVVLKDLRSESEQRTVPRDDVARLVTEGLRESR